MEKLKIFKNLTVILFISLVLATKGFCANINFDKGFISDGSDFLPERYENPLNSVLNNLHKETGCDLIVITINSFDNLETFKDIEKQVLSRYILGGENKDKWAMIIVTRIPYQMNIRVGKGLKKIIPPITVRSMGFEFFLNRITNTNTNNGVTTIYQNGAANNLYSTAMFLAELIADSQGKRLHTNEVRQDYNYAGYRHTEIMRAQEIPQNPPFTKFVRRNNLTPALFILAIGFLPFLFIPRSSRRRFISRLFRR